MNRVIIIVRKIRLKANGIDKIAFKLECVAFDCIIGEKWVWWFSFEHKKENLK